MKLKQLIPLGYEAYVLDNPTREMLSKHFPPKFPNWIGHHVTHRFGVKHDPSRPFGQDGRIDLIGYACTDGLEAFTVFCNGMSHRPDDKLYHLTWSLDPSKGFKPVDSNNLVLSGVQPLEHPISFFATFLFLQSSSS